MKNKRIAITGSHGFISGEILKHFITVYGIEREHYYFFRDCRMENLKEELEKFNPQIIIHTGSYGNHSFQTDDAKTFEANVVKTFLLLHATKDIPYEAFINFGSSSEYGKKSLPMREEDLLEPLTMYGCTKAAGTMLARAFAKKYDKPIVTVRPFSVYGEEEAKHRFIPVIMQCLFENKTLKLDEEGVHDWIYVSDFVEGVLKVIENAKTLQGQAVNIGTGKQYTNKEIAEIIMAIADFPLKTIKTYNTRTESNVWVANINTMKLLGWKPKVDILQGLTRVYNYYRIEYEYN